MVLMASRSTRHSTFLERTKVLIISSLIHWILYAASTYGSPIIHGPGIGRFSLPDPVVPLISERVAWRGPHRSILSRTVYIPGSSAAAAGKTITFDVLSPNHGTSVGCKIFFSSISYLARSSIVL